MFFDLVPSSRKRSGSSFALGASALLLAVTVALGGCASKTSRLPRKDMTVLQPGVAREVVIDELGAPASTTKSRAGNTVDVFTFVQGTGPSDKPPRPVEPEQAQATELLLLLEKSGKSPMKTFDGKKLSVQVTYDAALRVQESTMLRMEEAD